MAKPGLKALLENLLKRLGELVKSLGESSVVIEPVSNGAKVNAFGERSVYRFDEDDPEQMAEMLYQIRDALCMGSRYSKKRVSIVIEHGDKFTCGDKGCDICEEGQ